jgi:hypothetical protein
MTPSDSLVIYVDVDDALVRTVSGKRVPMPRVVERIRNLAAEGAQLYAWSSGGAPYARESARDLAIEDCFVAFLPKPQIVIDDQAPAEWRRLVHVYPTDASSQTLADLKARYARA